MKEELENESQKNTSSWLAAGLPSAIWHKKWSERFDLMEEGNKVGYANSSGWFFYAETKDEFIDQYIRLRNRGVIKPCR